MVRNAKNITKFRHCQKNTKFEEQLFEHMVFTNVDSK